MRYRLIMLALAVATLTGCGDATADRADGSSDALLTDVGADGSADGQVTKMPDATAPTDSHATDHATDEGEAPDSTPLDAVVPDASCGECAPGTVQTDAQACGACGDGVEQRTRTCTDGCTWSAWTGWGACSAGGCCGDGDADHSVDPATGWFVEECDEGAQNGVGDGACGVDCRYRRCDAGRACGPIRSTFGAYLPGDDAGMRTMLLKMREHGYEELIPVNSGAQEWTKSGATWSPTGVSDGFTDDSAGPSQMKRLVDLADKAGVKVVMGLGGLIASGGYDWEIWLNSGIRAPFVAYNLDLAADIVRQVGSSPAFGGFYISSEMNLGDSAQCIAAGDYYAALIAGAQGKQGLRALAGGKLVTIAPYLAVASRTPAQVGSNFACLFGKLQAAGGVDRIMVQDGVPKAAEGFTTLGNVGSYFAAMHAAIPAADRHVLWVDLETYAWPDESCFLSRPSDIARVGEQVREIGRWVNGFTQWIHAHNFTAAGLGQDACDAQRQALGDAYATRPFPFHAFIYQTSVVLRGYFLRSGGMARLQCSTAAGSQSFDFTGANLNVYYAASWLSDADVPDPAEVYEVTFTKPAACTGGYVVTYLGPDGTASSAVPF